MTELCHMSRAKCFRGLYNEDFYLLGYTTLEMQPNVKILALNFVKFHINF